MALQSGRGSALRRALLKPERIIYLDQHQPRTWFHGLPEGTRDLSAELIDPWAMTIEPLGLSDPPHYRYPRHVRNGELVTDQKRPIAGVSLPARPYLAPRAR